MINFFSSILYFLKNNITQIQSSSVRMLPYWIGAAITAGLSILFAKAFGASEDFALFWFRENSILVFIFAPVALLASTCLAIYFSPLAAGSGIPQLLAAVETSKTSTNPLLEKILGTRVIIAKLIGPCLCALGGGSTGREGPMLQIAGSIFYGIQRRWPEKYLKPNLQSMILAGGAAGLASAFNTPLGGVIFAVEELAKVHVSQVRTYIFHSVIIAGLLAQAALGNYLYLGKLPSIYSSISELFPLMLGSILIGALGAIFSLATVWVLDWRVQQSLKLRILMTVFCGLGFASLAYFFGESTIGSGRHLILELLSRPASASWSLGFLRGFGSFLTYISGCIGGIFAPALATGAAFGSWMSGVVDPANPQIWILAGMVAFLTGVTRTPFTSLILVLEMTDSHNVIITLMLSAIAAQSVAKLIDPISFYEHMSHRIIKAHEPLNQD